MTTTILDQACATAGLQAAAAQPVRLSENQTWRLRSGVIARITKPGQHEAAVREIAIANWLATHGVPAVRPVQGVTQPVLVDGRAVTFWEELPPHRHGTVLHVAHLLRRLHALPLPNFPIGRLDPFVRLPERIDASLLLPDDDRTWLHERVDALREAWQALSAGLPECVVHGDAWVGNVALAENGDAYLLDLERSSVGPPEWDLVSTAVKITSVGGVSREEYAQFVAVYGVDVIDWPGYQTMRDIRELRMTSAALQHANDNPEVRAEARYRLDCLRGRGTGPRPWKWTPIS